MSDSGPRPRFPHVFLLITKADIGGAQIHVLGIIKSLKHRIHFTLGCGERGFLTDQAKQLGIEVIVIRQLQRQISLTKDFSSVRAIKNILHTLKPDLLHAHSSKAGVVGRIAAKSVGIKSLFTAHGWAFTEGAGFTQRSYGSLVEWMLSRVGNGIISVSKYDYNLANRFTVRAPNGNWLIQNGVAPIQGQRIVNCSDEVRILTIGRMARAKNQKLMLQALTGIKRNFRLSIVGIGHLQPKLQQIVHELNLTTKVDFLGSVPDIGTLFLESDIFVLSSDYEGLPLSILEAMSAGLPVIATNVGGVSEAVLDGITGLLVERGDCVGLRRIITKLIDDPKLRKKFSDNGLAHYEKYFKLEKMCNHILLTYQELIG